MGLEMNAERPLVRGRLFLWLMESVAQLGSDELAVEAGNIADADALGALGLAGAGVGAVTESQLIHLGEHSLGAAGQ